jgi:hypothetical protein
MTLAEIVKETLDTRYNPLVEAKTCQEMNKIIDNTSCLFCDNLDCDDNDPECPLATGYYCCYGWYNSMIDAIDTDDFKTAHEYAVKIRDLIAGVDTKKEVKSCTK